MATVTDTLVGAPERVPGHPRQAGPVLRGFPLVWAFTRRRRQAKHTHMHAIGRRAAGACARVCPGSCGPCKRCDTAGSIPHHVTWSVALSPACACARVRWWRACTCRHAPCARVSCRAARPRLCMGELCMVPEHRRGVPQRAVVPCHCGWRCVGSSSRGCRRSRRRAPPLWEERQR